jgi:lipopolysaccharide/colanic/teichoic acid biosynthesis glycosyltransferase
VSRPRTRNWYTTWGKRSFDVVAAVSLLILLAPLLIVTSLLVRRRLGTPVYFHQDRPGLNGAVFRLQKFRTMTDARGADGELLGDDVRLTDFGRWLRSTSLDELPELWNILRGEMSFVGPRPLLVRYLPRYSTHQARRHEVRPGLTGWAQVNGRNATTWEDRLERDVWYVDHCSPWLDLKILLLTVKKVLWRDGVSAEGEATMSEFTGVSANSGERQAA